METQNSLGFKESNYQEDEIQVAAFRLGREEYAVDILKVQEINRLFSITRVPRSDKNIDGVVNLRGNIIPVINLHRKFNIEAVGDSDKKRIIVFQLDEVKAGIIVDEVSEVLIVKNSNIEETSQVYNSMDAELIKGIAKVGERLLIILDLEKLLGFAD